MRRLLASLLLVLAGPAGPGAASVLELTSVDGWTLVSGSGFQYTEGSAASAETARARASVDGTSGTLRISASSPPGTDAATAQANLSFELKNVGPTAINLSEGWLAARFTGTYSADTLPLMGIFAGVSVFRDNNFLFSSTTSSPLPGLAAPSSFSGGDFSFFTSSQAVTLGADQSLRIDLDFQVDMFEFLGDVFGQSVFFDGFQTGFFGLVLGDAATFRVADGLGIGTPDWFGRVVNATSRLAPPHDNPSVIPLPPGILLLASGLAGLGMACRRRRVPRR